MSGSIKYASYLVDAPVYSDMLKTGTTKPSDVFVNWFNQITLTMSESVVHARLFNGTSDPVIDKAIPLTRVSSMTEANRDLLQNPPNGAVIYNEDTKRFNFKEDAGWVTFTPVAA